LNQGRQGNLFDVDEDVFSLDTKRKDIDSFIRRKLSFSGLGMKGPGMPRTDDTIPFDPPLSQGAMTMRAPILES
jgi:hypothetical protein